jgi:hypothetical protein
VEMLLLARLVVGLSSGEYLLTVYWWIYIVPHSLDV